MKDRRGRAAVAAERGDASERIAVEISRHVARNRLRPGDRLGTQAELAEEFGVSRPTLREGLRRLASTHLVRASSGPGGGIFVESTPREALARNLSESIATMLESRNVSLRALVESRIQLEVPLAGLAAEHATDTTVLELESAIEQARGHDPASDAFRLADARFHRVLAETAGNDLLRAFTSWTLDVLQPSLIATLGASIDGAAIIRQHAEILRAVTHRQPEAARRAMRRHLSYLLEVLGDSDQEIPR